jgi:hypothetical protein
MLFFQFWMELRRVLNWFGKIEGLFEERMMGLGRF